jgi:hypothetical protein
LFVILRDFYSYPLQHFLLKGGTYTVSIMQ